MIGTVAFASGLEVSKKFKLYLKLREIKGIQRVLTEVTQLSSEEQDKWVEEYGEMVNTAIDSFVDDSSMTFESIFTDDEMLELSQELIITLKETIEAVEGMLYPDSQLES